jgi:hypothetical protein
VVGECRKGQQGRPPEKFEMHRVLPKRRGTRGGEAMKMRIQLILDDGTIFEAEEYQCKYHLHDSYCLDGSEAYAGGCLCGKCETVESPLISVTATVVLRDREVVDTIMRDAVHSWQEKR